MEMSTIGAILGLVVAIVLIIKKVSPAYSLIIGALVGGLVGGFTLADTVANMISGASGMMAAILRILTSGILAGVLIKTGSAEKIAEVIVSKLGEKRAIIAIAIASMILCSVGVFIDITVITVSPIALAIGKKAGYNKMSILLAMIGGGKAGNVISPNPNTIAAAESFNVDLSALMMENFIPALFALAATIILATVLTKKNTDAITDADIVQSDNSNLPSFLAAIAGPIVVIAVLALRPTMDISVDPLIALPLGCLVCALATGQIKNINDYASFGLTKVIGVAILLIGTGTIAGIIGASALKTDTIALLELMNMPAFVLAPIAGILMGGATASTTSGATLASQTFSGAILEAGIPAISGAAMVHAGATVVDSLPHGSFFHATAGATGTSFNERLKLIPYEAMIGGTTTIVAIILYLI